jgi:hypothetical protein
MGLVILVFLLGTRLLQLPGESTALLQRWVFAACLQTQQSFTSAFFLSSPACMPVQIPSLWLAQGVGIHGWQRQMLTTMSCCTLLSSKVLAA